MATIPKVTLLHIWRITSDLAHFSPETDGAVMEPLHQTGDRVVSPFRPLPIFDTLSTYCVWL